MLSFRSPTIRLLSTAFAGQVLLAGAPASAAAADRPVQITFAGLERTALVHLPAPLPAGAMPLVLAFHGGGGRGQGMARLSGLDLLADRRGFMVLYPDGVDRHWNDGRATIKRKIDDVGFVAALLDTMEQRYPVDAGRIYATGISNGGIFAERLACDLAGRIAAVAPVSGTLAADLAPSCTPARPVSVLQIAGTADPIMPFGGGNVADFGGIGEGGAVLSAEQTAAFWAARDGCAPAAPPAALPPLAAPDGTSVVATRWDTCAGGSRVELLALQGGGHTWPGGSQYAPRFVIGPVSHQLDATAIIDFFLAPPPHLPRR